MLQVCAGLIVKLKRFNPHLTPNDPHYLFYLLASFSSASIWWHIVYIAVPINLNSSKPILFYINSGYNNGKSNGSWLDTLPQLSYASQSIVVSMGQVPNQPITFMVDILMFEKEYFLCSYFFNLRVIL